MSAFVPAPFGDSDAIRSADAAHAAFVRAVHLGYSAVASRQFARIAKREASEWESPRETALRIVIPMGMPVPFIICADVKALLARMSDEQIEEWIEEAPQPKATKGKLRRRLKDDIAHIRHSGIACDIDDPFEGCAGIACAISTFRGAYAITLLVPSSRMPQKQDALIAALKETRDTVERLVGL